MADVHIYSLKWNDSFDSSALKNVLSSELNTVVSDGKIGAYDVDTSGAVDIRIPAIGTHSKWIDNIVIWCLKYM